MSRRADPRTLKLQKQLNNRIPLVGSWLRLEAARLLSQAARQGSPQAARILSLALITSPDEQVRALAETAMNSLDRRSCVDAIWIAWLDTRSPVLLKILLQKNWTATAPPRARVFSALRLERLELITRSDSEVVEPLVEALTEPFLAAGARECLLGLENQDSIDAFCAVWARTRQPELEDLVRQAGFLAERPAAVRVLTALLNQRTEILSSASADLVPGLVDAAQDPNPGIQNHARAALRSLLNPASVDALCAAWVTSRAAWLEEIIRTSAYLPSQPGPVRVLTLLMLESTGGLAALSPAEVPDLLAASADPDPRVAARVPAALRGLNRPETIDALCAVAAQDEHPLAVQVCQEQGFQPSAPEARALFLFMTGQWERYTALDFDQRLLRAVFETAAPGLRARLTRKLRQAGRTEFLTVLAGGDYRTRAPEMTAAEIEVLVHLLMQNGEHRRLWELSLELPVHWTAQILNHLHAAGFTPDHESDQTVYASLLEHAAAIDLAALEPLPAILPPALPRARVFVSGRVNDIAFHPTHHLLALATGSRKVILWDFQAARIVEVISGFSHSVGRVAYTDDGSLICAERTTSSQTCGVYIWQDERLTCLGHHTGSVTSLEPAGGSRVISCGKDERLVFWDIATGRLLAERKLNSWPRAARVSADRTQVVLLGKGLTVLTLPDLEVAASATLANQTGNGYSSGSVSRCAAFLPQAGSILVGKSNGRALVYALERSRYRPEHAPLLRMNVSIQGVEALPKHQLVLLASSDGRLQYLGWPSRKPLSQVAVPGERITALELSPDRSYLATGDSDASMALWDLRILDLPTLIKKPLSAFTRPEISTVQAVAVNADIQGPLLTAARLMQVALMHRNRFDIDLEATPAIRAGDFDILIEDALPGEPALCLDPEEV